MWEQKEENHSSNLFWGMEKKFSITWLMWINKRHTARQLYFKLLHRITGSQNQKLTILILINPLTPKISLVILPTVCLKVLMISIGRIWYWINLSSPDWVFIFILPTSQLDSVLMLKGEIQSWWLMGIKGSTQHVLSVNSIWHIFIAEST